jgi:hypothetical protein
MTAELENLGKITSKNCESLFLSKPFMSDGHTAKKANGTLTYVKYKNVVYGLTCSHIYEYQKNDFWLTVFGTNRVIYQFGHFESKGLVSDFRPLRKKPTNIDEPDIAIIKLGDPFPEIHMKHKNKVPIDIDSWKTPEWQSIKMGMACGFPTEHKKEDESFVKSPFLQVVAETTSRLEPHRESFMLASTLKTENTMFFSGMSGGPVFSDGETDETPTLIGIVFEGSPGSSTEWDQRSAESFLTKNDVQIRAHTFTPDIFESWLKVANYI